MFRDISCRHRITLRTVLDRKLPYGYILQVLLVQDNGYNYFSNKDIRESEFS